MRRARQPGRRRHARDRERAGDAAEVADVGLHDVDRAQLDHAPPLTASAVLLAARDVDVERRRDLGRPLELPVRARLLEVADAVVLEQAADLDRLRRRVAAVRVDQERRLVAERLAHRGDDGLGATRPLVLVVAALAADAELEAVVAVPSRRRARRSASSSGVMSRRMLEA